MAPDSFPVQEDAAVARRNLVVFLAVTLVLGASTIATNVVVNPFGKYPWRVLPPVIETARTEKSAALSATAPKPQALILGSSRTMKLAPSDIREQTGLTTYNASVHSARAEDLLAFYRLAERLDGPPLKLLVIGLDVEAAHNTVQPDARLLNNKRLLAELADQDIERSSLAAFGEDLGWPTLRASISSLRVSPADRWAESSQTTFNSAGFVTYGRDEKLKSENIFNLPKRIASSKQEYVARFRGFDQLDAVRLGRLEALFEAASSRGTRVVVFLTPLHPELLAHLQATNLVARLNDLRNWLHTFCATKKIVAYDATDPNRFGADLHGFFDGAHADRNNMRKLSHVLLELDGCAL